jgi:formiminoglutamase
MSQSPGWLTVERRDAPLIVSFPHTGTEIPADIEADLVSPWLARKDTDWWIDRLYEFVRELGATIVHTAISRTVIDVNRDPSGASLYPGQATTALCPTETFDGEPLYLPGRAPDAIEIARRRTCYFEPYHAAVAGEVTRLRTACSDLVLYDCHSIRSAVPRLFDGELPHMNIGTNSGASCDAVLQRAIEAICAASPFTWVANGRFKGGWITRNYGRPTDGVYAVQMELACRGYMDEPIGPVSTTSWPTAWQPGAAIEMRDTLGRVLEACVSFVRERERT